MSKCNNITLPYFCKYNPQQAQIQPALEFIIHTALYVVLLTVSHSMSNAFLQVLLWLLLYFKLVEAEQKKIGNAFLD